ncbi:MAG: UDP-N-acetylmuramoyl-tripeptide--D-alanyl-D-alanine ligase [Proteobacteria bacterium]|nr:UDP-N-acetylmuramoyl-tripeptide--D-alanyl-D-alanine ligase [Pseudomonadota bacterium]
MDETMLSFMDESELADALHARVVHPLNRKFKTACTDSRKVTPDDLFVALSGERFDAHDFIPDVVKTGCHGAVVSRDLDVPEDFTLFVVEDVLKSFGLLAKAILEKRRGLGNFTTYAVTGSNGKTTTKELLSLLLEAQGHCVLKTQGNFNNFVGLPMTVLNLTSQHDVAVLEMGANAPGEIAYLSGLGQPDIAIITCVGAAHLEGFGSLEGVAKAKGEMIDAPRLHKIVLPTETRRFYENRIPSGVEVVWVGNENSPEEIGIRNLTVHLDNIQFDYLDREKTVHLSLPLLGAHNAGNLARAIAALEGKTLTEAQLNEAIAKVHLPSGRMERWQSPEGTSFLHDAYNANPMSMAEAIKMMAKFKAPVCLVLGDMRELGPTSADLHRELGKSAARIHPVRILCVGEHAHDMKAGMLEEKYQESDAFCTSSENLADGLVWLSGALTPDTVCLIKGSRGVKLERVLEYFHASRK